jgi:hypothetical protein
MSPHSLQAKVKFLVSATVHGFSMEFVFGDTWQIVFFGVN